MNQPVIFRPSEVLVGNKRICQKCGNLSKETKSFSSAWLPGAVEIVEKCNRCDFKQHIGTMQGESNA